MNLRDCLQSAVEQGAISQTQADILFREFEARYGAKQRGGLNERAAARAARDEVSARLRTEAEENQRRLLLTEAKRKELTQYLADFRDHKGEQNLLDAALSLMVHNGYKGGRSMVGREMGILSLVHRDLAEVMHHFRRSGLSGRRLNRIDIVDLVREMNGDSTGRPEVRTLAKTLEKVQEDLRLRFNAAGGNIQKRQDFDLTHKHNAEKMKAGAKTNDEARENWKAFIAPLLDPERMINPKTGEIIGKANLDESLDYVWRSIMSEGWAHRKPEARKFGSGAVHSKYQDSRFLEFRDADAWLAYNEKFGDGDVISTVFDSIRNMAADIAAMETLGPNPDAMVEWLKNFVNVEYGKSHAGLDSLTEKIGLKSGLRGAALINYRLDSLWRSLRGRGTAWTAGAKWAADTRNLATSAMLGSTSILAAATDPVIAAMSRALAGIPIMKNFGETYKQLAKNARGGKGSLEAVRAGILWDDYLHTLHQEARFADQVFGHEWSKWLTDRALTVNGLKPLTQARKVAEAKAWHSTLGEYASRNADWIDLHPLLKKAMEGFGFTPDDWHKMRGGVDPMGFLDPGGILDRTGDLDLAERYAELITQWSERAVPSGNPRVKSALTGVTEKGTLPGEFVEFASQFMSFSLSFTARQLEAIHIFSSLGNSPLRRFGRGLAYTTSAGLALTIGAGFYSVVKDIADGRDIEEDYYTNWKFWAKSFIKGGGGGLFADFIDRSENRFGQSFKETIPGPGVSLISDSLDLTIGSMWQIMQGEAPKAGRKAVNFAGRYTPILASHPATRAIFRRTVVDQLQWMVDPAAHKSFEAKRRRAQYWWRPGDALPSSAPEADLNPFEAAR